MSSAKRPATATAGKPPVKKKAATKTAKASKEESSDDEISYNHKKHIDEAIKLIRDKGDENYGEQEENAIAKAICWSGAGQPASNHLVWRHGHKALNWFKAQMTRESIFHIIYDATQALPPVEWMQAAHVIANDSSRAFADTLKATEMGSMWKAKGRRVMGLWYNYYQMWVDGEGLPQDLRSLMEAEAHLVQDFHLHQAKHEVLKPSKILYWSNMVHGQCNLREKPWNKLTAWEQETRTRGETARANRIKLHRQYLGLPAEESATKRQTSENPKDISKMPDMAILVTTSDIPAKAAAVGGVIVQTATTNNTPTKVFGDAILQTSSTTRSGKRASLEGLVDESPSPTPASEQEKKETDNNSGQPGDKPYTELVELVEKQAVAIGELQSMVGFMQKELALACGHVRRHEATFEEVEWMIHNAVDVQQAAKIIQGCIARGREGTAATTKQELVTRLSNYRFKYGNPG
ncbi:hypothetical protein B0H67DRAFT_640843 [Lasiosphaeris hirsuta]|uniref:Uncharacterized protein n=1 Tax=Lasiosphaeris hirsuta TaxID=260670 RepID=A0AA40AYF9_9PEZI|nr:hypothetical protein B0H67DRAFT_640843 [Lasiosphaeris hirsuta]